MNTLIILMSIIGSWFTGTDTLVIAHRGASGYLPEHSLAAKTLAHAQGADYIEQDVVLSKDGVPVVLHDILLDDVTNVTDRFPARQRPDGHYYVADFTLEELKQLQLRERFNPKTGERVFPQRFPEGDSGMHIVTLEEEIRLIQGLNRVLQKDTGLYVEIKKPHWHRQQGLDISRAVLDTLKQHGYHDKSHKVFVQCFDFAETQRLRKELNTQLKLVQLIGENHWQESPTDYDFLKTPEGINAIAKVADSVGPSITQLLSDDPLEPSEFFNALRQHSLPIHAYTLRKDTLPDGVSFSDASNVLIHRLKLEGIFTDFPDLLRRQL